MPIFGAHIQSAQKQKHSGSTALCNTKVIWKRTTAWGWFQMDKILEKILDNLFDDYVAMAPKSEDILKLEVDVENNRKWLIQSLGKGQNKLLLRLQDGKDSIKEINSMQSFNTGFKLGLRFGYEINNE
jgi:hypothetical protein